MSTTLMTSMSLLSCLSICSSTPSSPRATMVMRDMLSSSVSPTARLMMLKARPEKRPATRASTPGWFSTVTAIIFVCSIVLLLNFPLPLWEGIKGRVMQRIQLNPSPHLYPPPQGGRRDAVYFTKTIILSEPAVYHRMQRGAGRDHGPDVLFPGCFKIHYDQAFVRECFFQCLFNIGFFFYPVAFCAVCFCELYKIHAVFYKR